MSETIICGANAEGLEALRWPNGERVPGTTAEEMANGVRQLLGLDPHPPKL
ncbi:hypothetical protein [Actinomadura oligospora]|uniref:hypothetical protein n=1 Tax=Actinomadura oligospora TaxID=111804 RepID=UPI0012FA7AFB|nr:hypothetical protein [Actinomadura oligospora]